MQTVDSAKQFLLDRINEQASKDGVTLSEVEKRMFLFSELSSAPDWEANEKFEAELDDAEYERKIAKLLRRAYAHDRKTSESTWREAMGALKREDFYGLVMVDQAKIPRPKDYLSAKSVFSSYDPVFLLLEVAILGVAFGVLSNRIHSSLFGSDNSRLVVVALLVALAWGIGKMYGRLQSKRAAERLRRLDSDGNSQP